MNKRLPALAAALTLALGGCGAPAPSSAPAAGPPELAMEELAAWPENESTALVPVPPGEADYAVKGEGRYSVSLSGVTREEGEAYRDALLEAGFAQAAGASEEASGGFLLESPEAWVSVALSDGGMAVEIAPKPEG